MPDLKTLSVEAENGSFTFPVVDQVARDLAQAAKDAVEGASGPIQRIESLDSSNYVYLRDLASGVYILYGYFRPYSGAASRLVMDNVLVSVAADSTGSHILAISTVNSKVDFFTIEVDETQTSGFAYTRTNISLLDLHGLIAKVGSLDDLATTEKGSIVGALNEVVANAESEEPSVKSIAMVLADNQITVTTTMEDDGIHTDVITLDSNGYPSNINVGGVDIPLTFEGFEEATADG